VAGAVVSDVVHVAGWQASSPAAEATGDGVGAAGPPPGPPRLIFGCAARETDEIKAQRAAGILGLGDAGAGFAHQPAAACGGSGGAAFGLCLGGGPRGGGALILGAGLPPAVLAAVAGPAVRVPVVAGPEHPHCCAAPLEGAAFGPTPLAVAAATFADGHGAVLDSGTTFTHLPPAAFHPAARVLTAAAESAGLPRVVAARGYGDVCFGRLPTDAAIAAAFSNMTLTFAGGGRLDLRPGSYLFRHADTADAACVGLFAAPAGKGSLIGAATMRDTLVTFDARARRVGMAVADCGAVGDAARSVRPAASSAPSSVHPPPRSTIVTGLPFAAPAAVLAVGAGAAAAVAARRRARAAAEPPGALPSPGSHKTMYRPMSADEDAAA